MHRTTRDHALFRPCGRLGIHIHRPFHRLLDDFRLARLTIRIPVRVFVGRFNRGRVASGEWFDHDGWQDLQFVGFGDRGDRAVVGRPVRRFLPGQRTRAFTPAVATVGSVESSSSEVVGPDHSGLEVEEETFDVWNTRRDDIHVLHKGSAENFGPQIKGRVRGGGGSIEIDQLGDNRGDHPGIC